MTTHERNARPYTKRKRNANDADILLSFRGHYFLLLLVIVGIVIVIVAVVVAASLLPFLPGNNGKTALTLFVSNIITGYIYKYLLKPRK